MESRQLPLGKHKRICIIRETEEGAVERYTMLEEQILLKGVLHLERIYSISLLIWFSRRIERAEKQITIWPPSPKEPTRDL